MFAFSPTNVIESASKTRKKISVKGRNADTKNLINLPSTVRHLFLKHMKILNSPTMMIILSPLLLLEKVINGKLVDWHACRREKLISLLRWLGWGLRNVIDTRKLKRSWKLLWLREMMFWAFVWNNKREKGDDDASPCV